MHQRLSSETWQHCKTALTRIRITSSKQKLEKNISLNTYLNLYITTLDDSQLSTLTKYRYQRCQISNLRSRAFQDCISRSKADIDRLTKDLVPRFLPGPPQETLDVSPATSTSSKTNVHITVHSFFTRSSTNTTSPPTLATSFTTNGSKTILSTLRGHATKAPSIR